MKRQQPAEESLQPSGPSFEDDSFTNRRTPAADLTSTFCNNLMTGIHGNSVD